MNVLLVTQDTPAAELIERELPKRLSGLKISTAREVQEAVERLASPGAFRAVVLDAALPEADLFSLRKAARAENGAVPLISLVEESDPASSQEMPDAVTDERLAKSEGFIDRLAALLRRAGGDIPRVLYSAAGSVPTSPPAEYVPVPETAPATRVLIRRSELVLSRWPAKVPRQEHSHQIKVSSRHTGETPQNAYRRSLQDDVFELRLKLQEAEREKARLAEALRVNEIQLEARMEEMQHERMHWNAFRSALSRKLTEIENRRIRLQRAMFEEERRHQISAEQHRMEMAQWESARLDLELENRRLQEKIARLEEENAARFSEGRNPRFHRETPDTIPESRAGEPDAGRPHIPQTK